MAYRRKIQKYIWIYVYMKWGNALGLFKRFNVEKRKNGRGVFLFSSTWVLIVSWLWLKSLHIKTLDIVPASSRWLFLFEYRTLCSFIFIVWVFSGSLGKKTLRLAHIKLTDGLKYYWQFYNDIIQWLLWDVCYIHDFIFFFFGDW